MLVAAEKGRVRPIICINKTDLIEPANLEPLVGVHSRMGYPVLLVARRPASASIVSAALSRDGKASWPGKAAWASRRC